MAISRNLSPSSVTSSGRNVNPTPNPSYDEPEPKPFNPVPNPSYEPPPKPFNPVPSPSTDIGSNPPPSGIGENQPPSDTVYTEPSTDTYTQPTTTTTTVPVQQTTTTPQILPSSDIERTIYGSSTAVEDKASVERGKTERQILLDRKLRGSIMGVGIYDMLQQFGESGDLNELLDKLRSQLEKNGITQENIDKFIQLLKDNDYFKDKSYEEVETQLKTVFTTDNDRIYKTIYGFILFRNALEKSPPIMGMFGNWGDTFDKLLTGDKDVDFFEYWQKYSTGEIGESGITSPAPTGVPIDTDILLNQLDAIRKRNGTVDKELAGKVPIVPINYDTEKISKEWLAIIKRIDLSNKSPEEISKILEKISADVTQYGLDTEIITTLVERINAAQGKTGVAYSYTAPKKAGVNTSRVDVANLNMINNQAYMNDWQTQVDSYQAIIDDPANYDYQTDPGYEEARQQLIDDGWESYTIQTAAGEQTMWKKPKAVVAQAQYDLAYATEKLNYYTQQYENAKREYDILSSMINITATPSTTTEPITVDNIPQVGESYTEEDGNVGIVASVDTDPVTGLITVFVQVSDNPEDGGHYYYYSVVDGQYVRTDKDGNILTTTKETPTVVNTPSGVFKQSEGVYVERDANGTLISTAYITDESITIVGGAFGQTQTFNKATDPEAYYNLLIYYTSGGTVNPNNLNQGGHWVGDTYYDFNGNAVYQKESGILDPNVKVRDDINATSTPNSPNIPYEEVTIPENAESYPIYDINGNVVSTAYITDEMVIIIGGASLDVGHPIVYKKSEEPDFYQKWKEYYENGGVFTPTQSEIASYSEERLAELVEQYPALEGKLELTDPYWIARQQQQQAQSDYDSLLDQYSEGQKTAGVYQVSEGVYEVRNPDGKVISTAYINGDTIVIEGIDLVGTQTFNRLEEPEAYYNLLIYYLSRGLVNPNNLNQGGHWEGETYYTNDGQAYYQIGEGMLNPTPVVTQEELDVAYDKLQQANSELQSMKEPDTTEPLSEYEQLQLLYNRFQKYGSIKEAIKGGMTEEQLKALGFTESQIEVAQYSDVQSAIAGGVSETTLALAGVSTSTLGTQRYIENIKKEFKEYEIDIWTPEGFQQSYDIVGLVEAVDEGKLNEDYLKYMFGDKTIQQTREAIAQNKQDMATLAPYASVEYEYQTDPGYEEARQQLIDDGWESYTIQTAAGEQTMWRKANTTGYDITRAIAEGIDREILVRMFGNEAVNQSEAILAVYQGDKEQYLTDINTISQYAIGAEEAYQYYDYKTDPGYEEARQQLIDDGWESYTIQTAAGEQTMWRKATQGLKEYVSTGQAVGVSYDTIQIVKDVISGSLDSGTVDRLFGEDFLDTYQPAIEAIGTSANPLEAKQNGVNDEYIDLIWGVGSANAAQQVLDKWQNDIIALNASGVITTNDKGETVVDVGLAAQRGLSYSELQVLTNNGLSISEEEYNKYVSQLSAINSLAGYSSIDNEGNTVYDIDKFIVDNPTLESIQILTNAGFDADTIAKATDYVNGTQDVLSRLQNTLYGTQGYSDKLILDIKAEELGLIEKAYQEKGLESGIHPSYFGTQLVQGSLLGEEGTGTYHILDYEKFIDSLSDSDKNRLAGAMANDPNISNSFAATVAKLNYEYEKLPQVVQIGIVFIPYIGMPLMASQMVSTTIAKATTGQNITAMEIATDAAATALAVLTHIPVKTLSAKLTAKTIEVGAVGTFATDIALNWKEMSVKDQYINIAMMMIPAIGWSRGLGRAIKNKILEGSPEAPIKVAEKQKVLLDNIIQVNKDLITKITIKDPVVRQEASVKVDEMQKNINEYTDTALELAQTRKAIADVGLAKSKAELDLLEKLQMREKELSGKIIELSDPLKKSISEYNNVITKAISKDDPLILKDERIKNLPDTIKGDLDAIVNQIVNPRNAVDVYKDTQTLNKQIEELEVSIKRIDRLSIEEIKGIEELIQDLKRQIISLNKEARLLELTGETVKVKGKDVKLEIQSLQSKLIEANKKLAEYQTTLLEGTKISESGIVVDRSKLGGMGTLVETPNAPVNREVRDMIDTVADIYGLKSPERVKEVGKIGKNKYIVGRTTLSGDYIVIVKKLKKQGFEQQLETIVHELVHSNYTTIGKDGRRSLDNILGKELFSDAEEYIKTQLRKEGWKTEEYINNEMEAYKGAIDKTITEIFTIYKTEALTGAKNDWYLNKNIQLLSDILSSENKAKVIANNIKEIAFVDTKNTIPISKAEQYFTDYQKAELNTAIAEAEFRGDYSESRESPLSYETHRKGELIAEADVAKAERDIFEAVENIYEPLYGKESYAKELNILNEKLDSIITMMKEFGISEKETVKMSFDLYDAIIKKDVKKVNEVVKQLQLQAGKIPDKMLQLKAGEEIKLLAVRAEDLMSSFKFTQKPPKSEYETVYEAEPVDNSIIREVERIYQTRYEKLTRTMPEARRTSEEIIEYLREKYDTEYFESAYEGRYKDVDDFLDMNRIEQEIRNQKRKYEEELADIKRDIDIHEKEIELTDIFKKKENINKETKDLIDERAEELKRQIEEKKRKLQLAEKEALNIPLEKTRGTEEPVRTEESLITSEKALMPKEKAVEKLVEEIESEIKARKAVEEGRTELERRKVKGESIFGIKPKVKISDYAIRESEREHIGAMTPEQKQRLYGVESERVIDARSPYIRTIPDIDTYIKTIPTIIPEPEPISIPITEPITLPQPDIITVPITKPIVQPDTKTVALPQPETQVLPKEEIKEQTKTETITIPVEEPKDEIKIETKTKTQVTKIIDKKSWDIQVEKWKKEGFPAGTITWKQGMFWKVIPPPYDKDRPISMFDPPRGAVNTDLTGEGAAYGTLQVLGDKVPKDVRVDLGSMDIYITTDPETKKPRIQYLQGGLETNVGDREPSNYSGMTILNAPSTKDTAKEQYVSKDLRNRGLKKKALSLSEAIEEEPETKMSFETKYNKPKQNNIKRANMVEESNLDRYYLGHKLPDSGLEVQI